MSKEEILQEQIKALEKLIELKNEIIKEYEGRLKVKTLPDSKSYPTWPWEIKQPHQYIPSTSITICNAHEYDHTVSPSKCKKCGHSLGYTITYASDGS